MDYSPKGIAERNARSQKEAVEGLRKIQKQDGINFAQMFRAAGNLAAAEEFEQTVDKEEPDGK